MTAINLYDLDGKVLRQESLPDDLFAAKIVKSLIHDVIRAEESARRQGNADTKTRSDVSGGGKKPWKQKHTGRARHGSTRSPIWRKGGTVFGPHPRSYAVKINRKARKIALAGALSARAQEERIVGLEAKGLDKPKTKSVAVFLKNFTEAKKPLLIHTREDDSLVRSLRNIRNTSHANWQSLSARNVLLADLLILTGSTIAALRARETNSEATA